MIKVTFAAKRPQGAYALAIPVRSEDMLHERLAGLDEPARTLAARSAEAQRFEREVGAIAETFIEDGKLTRRLLLVGYGAKQDEVAIHERVGGALTAKLLTSGETKLVIESAGLDGRAAARLAFGAAARSWRHDVYRTKLGRKQKPTLEEVVIVGADKAAEKEWAHEAAVLAGLDFTRALVSDPPNVVYPETFVERCRAGLEGLGVEFEVLDEKAMRKLGMGALLGVAQGSVRPPRLLAMRWNGAAKSKQDRRLRRQGRSPSIPAASRSSRPLGMESMKWDMGGAGAVAGAMKALAVRKAKANVVGICALAENMPDGNAQRPGDIVTSMSGQTIEVINTDAEGRLVLADAMTWVQRQYKPEVMIDLATLTGAMIISLGHEYGGMFANDDGLAEQLFGGQPDERRQTVAAADGRGL